MNRAPVLLAGAILAGGAAFAGSRLVASGAASAASGPSLDRGVVDVTTNLALQDGAAAGTGIVIDRSGLVLTNNHVIAGAGTIRVRDVATGRSSNASVVGTDVADDVALLRIAKPSGLAAASLGTSSTVSVGQSVTAVGNAGGAGGDPTHASGTVTRLNRSITVRDGAGGSKRLTGLIQISAVLEPGDSGGPLYSAAGKVIGMNAAASFGYRFTSAAGRGFAIPIDRALTIARSMAAGQRTARIHIGPAARLGVQVSDAARVVGVAPGTPAARAGLRPGDTLVSLGGTRLASANGIPALMQRYYPGDAIRVGWVDRDGLSHSALVTLIAGPPA